MAQSSSMQSPRMQTNPDVNVDDWVELAKQYPSLLAYLAGFDTLDEWQDDILNSDSNRILMLCARQTGKSSIVALLALHHALSQPEAMIMIISKTWPQAAETFRKIVNFYRRIPNPIDANVDSAHRLELENGSRIITLSGQRPDSIRGYSGVTLLIVDEASQVLEESYDVARPMLAVSNGRIVLLSTPHGRSGFFYDAWRDLKDKNIEGWHGIEVNWQDCPRLTPEFIKEEQRKYPQWYFNQEFCNSFEEGNQSIINPEAIRESFVDRPGRDLKF